MSQHAMTIANQAGAAFRADLNNALGAIATNNSGATAPSTTYAYQPWADSATGLFKQRNSSNTAWVTICKLSNWALASVQTQAATAFTTGGSGTAYTLTTDPAEASLVEDQRYQVEWHSANGIAPTLARDGLTAKNIKVYNSLGAKVAPLAGALAAGSKGDVVYDGTDYVVLGVYGAVDEFVNPQTGTTYTYLTGDKGKLVTHSNAAAVVGTLPQAGSAFPSGWWVDVQNRGAGTLTITPTTSTVDGLTAIVLTTAQGVRLISDGTNYFTHRGAGTSEAYVHIREQQASGTDGGGFTAAAWQTRVLNTEVSDASNVATLSSNQITLLAGTYRFQARAPAWAVDFNKLRLRNITDAVDFIGSTATASALDNIQTDCWVCGKFTISGSKVFELQHYAQTTKTVNGFGRAASFPSTVEVFAEIEFWKEI